MIFLKEMTLQKCNYFIF